MANSVDQDQTPIGAVCSGSTLFASILNWSVMIGDYLQQMTSADSIFKCIFFLGAFRVNCGHPRLAIIVWETMSIVSLHVCVHLVSLSVFFWLFLCVQ